MYRMKRNIRNMDKAYRAFAASYDAKCFKQAYIGKYTRLDRSSLGTKTWWCQALIWKWWMTDIAEYLAESSFRQYRCAFTINHSICLPANSSQLMLFIWQNHSRFKSGSTWTKRAIYQVQTYLRWNTTATYRYSSFSIVRNGRQNYSADSSSN